MIDCKRCGQPTPRLTTTTRYCAVCLLEIAQRERLDARRVSRFVPKDLSHALR